MCIGYPASACATPYHPDQACTSRKEAGSPCISATDTCNEANKQPINASSYLTNQGPNAKSGFNGLEMVSKQEVFDTKSYSVANQEFTSISGFNTPVFERKEMLVDSMETCVDNNSTEVEADKEKNVNEVSENSGLTNDILHENNDSKIEEIADTKQQSTLQKVRIRKRRPRKPKTPPPEFIYNCDQCGEGYNSLLEINYHKQKCIPDEEYIRKRLNELETTKQNGVNDNGFINDEDQIDSRCDRLPSQESNDKSMSKSPVSYKEKFLSMDISEFQVNDFESTTFEANNLQVHSISGFNSPAGESKDVSFEFKNLDSMSSELQEAIKNNSHFNCDSEVTKDLEHEQDKIIEEENKNDKIQPTNNVTHDTNISNVDSNSKEISKEIDGEEQKKQKTKSKVRIRKRRPVRPPKPKSPSPEYVYICSDCGEGYNSKLEIDYHKKKCVPDPEYIKKKQEESEAALKNKSFPAEQNKSFECEVTNELDANSNYECSAVLRLLSHSDKSSFRPIEAPTEASFVDNIKSHQFKTPDNVLSNTNCDSIQETKSPAFDCKLSDEITSLKFDQNLNVDNFDDINEDLEITKLTCENSFEVSSNSAFEEYKTYLRPSKSEETNGNIDRIVELEDNVSSLSKEKSTEDDKQPQNNINRSPSPVTTKDEILKSLSIQPTEESLLQAAYKKSLTIDSSSSSKSPNMRPQKVEKTVSRPTSQVIYLSYNSFLPPAEPSKALVRRPKKEVVKHGFHQQKIF